MNMKEIKPKINNVPKSDHIVLEALRVYIAGEINSAIVKQIINPSLDKIVSIGEWRNSKISLLKNAK